MIHTTTAAPRTAAPVHASAFQLCVVTANFTLCLQLVSALLSIVVNLAANTLAEHSGIFREALLLSPYVRARLRT